MINWVEGLTRELGTRGQLGHLSPEEIVETVRRYFVARELVVSEVDYVLGLRQRAELAEERLADLRAYLAARAAVLGNLGAELLAKSEAGQARQ